MALFSLKAPGDVLDRLIGLSLSEIQTVTSAYLTNRNLPRWEAEMRRILTTSHTATYLAATAERLNLSPDSNLFQRNRLTRAEKADIQRAVNRQLEYLRGFVKAIKEDNLSDAQIRARANLYGPSVKAFYYQQRWGDWVIPDNLLPGNQQCLSNCLCRGYISADNGDGTGIWTREMGGTEQHCTECPGLAGDHPVKRKAA